jgi:hypothetical protein
VPCPGPLATSATLLHSKVKYYEVAGLSGATARSAWSACAFFVFE